MCGITKFVAIYVDSYSFYLSWTEHQQSVLMGQFAINHLIIQPTNPLTNQPVSEYMYQYNRRQYSSYYQS